jgi:hypothetical protein
MLIYVCIRAYENNMYTYFPHFSNFSSNRHAYLQNSLSVINDVTDIISCGTHGQKKWIKFLITVFHSHYKQFDK